MTLLPIHIPTINLLGHTCEKEYFIDHNTNEASIFLDDFYVEQPATIEELIRASSYGLGVLIADAHSREVQKIHFRIKNKDKKIFLPLDAGLGIGVALGVEPFIKLEGLGALEHVTDLDCAQLNFGAAQMDMSWDSVDNILESDSRSTVESIHKNFADRLHIEYNPESYGIQTIFNYIRL